MTLRSWHGLLFAGVLACGSPPPVSAPQDDRAGLGKDKGAAPEQQPLALDARISHGVLDNGLSYFVLPHQQPAKRAQLWLVVNAGSVLEDDDQQGLAHFVEHLGFNGTRRFPKQELVDFLEKTGLRFGPDLNAYTTFDETVYMLQVPTNDEALVDRALSVLRDWADGMSFDSDEIEKERGVVLEEWRLGRGANQRLIDKQAPVLFQGSKYQARLPIGKPEIIRSASRETLRRFYRDWYRPDLMAVVAVGDFDRARMTGRIAREFASLKGSATPRPRPVVALPAHDETLFTIVSDKELPQTSVTIVSKLPRRPKASARDMRRMLAEQLFNGMLNARLDELRLRPDAPFLMARSSSGGLLRNADAFRQMAATEQDGVERAFAALLEELLRVERHGFVATELERAQAQLLRYFQQAVKERDKIDNRELAAEVVRHFLEGEAMPGREAELRLVEQFLPSFTLAELNQLARSLGSQSRVVLVAGPAADALPTQSALLAVDREVKGSQLAQYDDAPPSTPLMKGAPERSAVTALPGVPEIGVHEWKLSNGVRIVAKSTDFDNDKLYMRAFSPGGHSLVADAHFASARFADEVVSQGGVGPFSTVALRKLLAGKVVSARAHIEELEEGFSGMASPSDLETLLQLVYLGFRAPRRDAEAFDAWRRRQIEVATGRRRTPEGVFFEEMQVFSTQNHLRRRPVTPELLKQVDLDRAMGIYAERFADAGDFTFVFVGNIELPVLEELTARYLGSLPTKKRKESFRDVKVTTPRGVQEKIVKQGTEPKARVTLAFHGAERWSRDAQNDMRSLGEILRFRLRQTLREDLGGVYGVQVAGQIARRPRQEYRFVISFGCAPDNVDKLTRAVFDEIGSVKSKGAEDDDIAKAKEARRKAHETDVSTNRFWLEELTRAYSFGDDPRNIPNITPMVDKVTSARVMAAAKRYLNEKQYLRGVLLPATP